MDFDRHIDALRRLDLDYLKEFLRKQGAPLPDSDENVLAGAHKARLVVPQFTAEEKELSRAWLLEHGFKLGIGGL